MTKKQFESACRALEAQGYGIDKYEPQNKHAVYRHPNGSVREIGGRKK
jgi:hypothetical protein